MRHISLPAAQGFVARALAARDVPAADAETVAACLLAADLEGQASHGIARLPFLLERLASGWIAPRPDIRVLNDRPASAVLDAGNGLGPLAGLRGMAIAMDKARAAGVGVCVVRHSNHLGALGFYVNTAAHAGLVGLAFTNTPPAMAPPGGKAPFLGTNPIAAAFPTSADPIVIDLSTSQVARGKILTAAREGRPIPLGWATGAGGNATTDPEEALKGALLPLGGAKGFALALLVEVLAGVLSGAAVGPDVQGTVTHVDRATNAGHCFQAFDPGAFGDDFVRRMDQLASAIRAVEPADPAAPVRLPGDRRVSERSYREQAGIDVPDEVAAQLERLTGTPFA